MLISEKYVSQNQSLHEKGNFGISGYKWADIVLWLVTHHQIKHLLDYGAGQQTLKKALIQHTHIQIDCYDPAIAELATPPESAELVTCTDVLEHIEPKAIDVVLDHIQSIASRYVFLVIPTGPATKTLPDGRNAHLIQQPVHWWLPKLIQRFNLISLNNVSSDIVFFGSARGEVDSRVQTELMALLNHAPSMQRLQSISMDGLYWKVAYKSKNPLERLLPRLISIFKLGKKMGVSERVRAEGGTPRFEISRY